MEGGKNKVGRPRNVGSPDEMWEMFERYKEFTKSNPRHKMEVTRSGVTPIPLEVPLTMVGFYNFARKRVGDVKQYFIEVETYPEFLTICHAIKDEVQQDQIEGGMVNIYNPSITQRLNSLSEKVEVSQFPSPIIELPNEPNDSKPEAGEGVAAT